jgi:hypothetical protein
MIVARSSAGELSGSDLAWSGSIKQENVANATIVPVSLRIDGVPFQETENFRSAACQTRARRMVRCNRWPEQNASQIADDTEVIEIDRCEQIVDERSLLGCFRLQSLPACQIIQVRASRIAGDATFAF